MPTNLLNVSYIPQKRESDCLPVCAQMVLAYLGISATYDQLYTLLETKWFGTPFEKITRVESLGTSVSIDYLGLAAIKGYLNNNLPVIAGVHTADLSYWTESVDHVVVVIGLDDQHIYLHDPAFGQGPQPVPLVEFELAQLGFDNLCAVVQRIKP